MVATEVGGLEGGNTPTAGASSSNGAVVAAAVQASKQATPPPASVTGGQSASGGQFVYNKSNDTASYGATQGDALAQAGLPGTTRVIGGVGSSGGSQSSSGQLAGEVPTASPTAITTTTPPDLTYNQFQNAVKASSLSLPNNQYAISYQVPNGGTFDVLVAVPYTSLTEPGTPNAYGKAIDQAYSAYIQSLGNPQGLKALSTNGVKLSLDLINGDGTISGYTSKAPSTSASSIGGEQNPFPQKSNYYQNLDSIDNAYADFNIGKATPQEISLLEQQGLVMAPYSETQPNAQGIVFENSTGKPELINSPYSTSHVVNANEYANSVLFPQNDQLSKSLNSTNTTLKNNETTLTSSPYSYNTQQNINNLYPKLSGSSVAKTILTDNSITNSQNLQKSNTLSVFSNPFTLQYYQKVLSGLTGTIANTTNPLELISQAMQKANALAQLGYVPKDFPDYVLGLSVAPLIVSGIGGATLAGAGTEAGALGGFLSGLQFTGSSAALNAGLELGQNMLTIGENIFSQPDYADKSSINTAPISLTTGLEGSAIVGAGSGALTTPLLLGSPIQSGIRSVIANKGISSILGKTEAEDNLIAKALTQIPQAQIGIGTWSGINQALAEAGGGNNPSLSDIQNASAIGALLGTGFSVAPIAGEAVGALSTKISQLPSSIINRLNIPTTESLLAKVPGYNKLSSITSQIPSVPKALSKLPGGNLINKRIIKPLIKESQRISSPEELQKEVSALTKAGIYFGTGVGINTLEGSPLPWYLAGGITTALPYAIQKGNKLFDSASQQVLRNRPTQWPGTENLKSIKIYLQDNTFDPKNIGTMKFVNILNDLDYLNSHNIEPIQKDLAETQAKLVPESIIPNGKGENYLVVARPVGDGLSISYWVDGNPETVVSSLKSIRNAIIDLSSKPELATQIKENLDNVDQKTYSELEGVYSTRPSLQFYEYETNNGDKFIVNVKADNKFFTANPFVEGGVISGSNFAINTGGSATYELRGYLNSKLSRTLGLKPNEVLLKSGTYSTVPENEFVNNGARTTQPPGLPKIIAHGAGDEENPLSLTMRYLPLEQNTGAIREDEGKTGFGFTSDFIEKELTPGKDYNYRIVAHTNQPTSRPIEMVMGKRLSFDKILQDPNAYKVNTERTLKGENAELTARDIEERYRQYANSGFRGGKIYDLDARAFAPDLKAQESALLNLKEAIKSGKYKDLPETLSEIYNLDATSEEAPSPVSLQETQNQNQLQSETEQNQIQEVLTPSEIRNYIQSNEQTPYENEALLPGSTSRLNNDQFQLQRSSPELTKEDYARLLNLSANLQSEEVLSRPQEILQKDQRFQLQKEIQKQSQSQLQNQIQRQTQNQLQNQIQKQTQNQVQNQLQDEIQFQLQNQIQNQVQNQVQSQVQSQLQNQLQLQLQQQIQTTPDLPPPTKKPVQPPRLFQGEPKPLLAKEQAIIDSNPQVGIYHPDINFLNTETAGLGPNPSLYGISERGEYLNPQEVSYLNNQQVYVRPENQAQPEAQPQSNVALGAKLGEAQGPGQEAKLPSSISIDPLSPQIAQNYAIQSGLGNPNELINTLPANIRLLLNSLPQETGNALLQAFVAAQYGARNPGAAIANAPMDTNLEVPVHIPGQPEIPGLQNQIITPGQAPPPVQGKALLPLPEESPILKYNRTPQINSLYGVLNQLYQLGAIPIDQYWSLVSSLMREVVTGGQKETGDLLQMGVPIQRRSLAYA